MCCLVFSIIAIPTEVLQNVSIIDYCVFVIGMNILAANERVGIVAATQTCHWRTIFVIFISHSQITAFAGVRITVAQQGV